MKSSTAKRIVIPLSLLLLLVVGAVSASNMDTASGKGSAQGRCSEVDDATLAARVSAKISENASLAGQYINVAAKAGVVTLTGNVSSRTKRQIAGRLARGVVCVKRIVNDVEVTSTIIPFDYTCCCEEGCYRSSRPCLQCKAIQHCFDSYGEAMKAGGSKRGGPGYGKNSLWANPKARREFYDCISKVP
jgi:Predicted periplasmic or secreted lipoprotein